MKRIYFLTIPLVFYSSSVWSDPLAIPPNVIATDNKPMVILSTSKDVSMFGKAYTDYDDIDFDNIVDKTFKATYKYYGYFDPLKCYTYVNTSTVKQFEPKKMAIVGSGLYGDPAGYYCTAGANEWSGNFLNWLSMSRMDVLRKVLYGGMRSTDTATSTALELSFVPGNSQAIVKYYNGSDLKNLTPFNDADSISRGVTFCRRQAEASGISHVNAFIPEIRVALGNAALWNMTEVKTCNWSGDIPYTWQTPTINYLNTYYQTPAGTTGATEPNHQHLSSVPPKGVVSGTTFNNTGYVGRVAACVSSLLGAEKCKNYGTATTPQYKPIGLLHEFGESENSGVLAARSEFALMMGSYDNNLRGGVLRKNMGQINDEINPVTGQFISLPTGSGGIVKSLNEITLYGYDASSGTYGTDVCSSTERFTDVLTNGKCPSWGNPIGELLLESLRYYAGKAPAFATGTLDNNVGLPYVTTSTDPLKNNPTMGATTRTKLYGQPICRPLNMITITNGSNSWDDDLVKFSDINTSGSAATTAQSLTSNIGSLELINGTTRLIGAVLNGTGANDQNILCTPKVITTLDQASGICADGPNFKGSYLGAGIAHFANTNKIRTDITPVPTDVPGRSLMVKNYGISMSGGSATIVIPRPNNKKLYITPASLDQINGKNLPANLVDFKYIKLANDMSSGTALVLWQHSMLGEDQDQDQLQSLRWEISGSTLKVYTQAVEANTGSSSPMATGYTLVGTDADGVHLHSSINNYPTTESGLDTSLALYSGTTIGATGTGCVLQSRSLCVKIGSNYYRGETFKTYNITGAANALIREPLWYISKYGGFNYSTKPEIRTTQLLAPDLTNRVAWDAKRADGKTCGGVTGRTCADGEPDNYFSAKSPELLETALKDVFENIVATSNAAPAVATGQLRSGDLKYVAKFDPADGHGELSAFSLQGGKFRKTPSWQAHVKLSETAAISRAVITNNGSTGIAFQWPALSSTKQDVLKSGIVDVTEATAFGKDMMQWIRGDATNKSSFRIRNGSSVMGAVVNSNPAVQTKPLAKFYDADYATFLATWSTRKQLVWVGAGDGMLHGFEAGLAGGKPIFSYIPEPVFAKLPDWASALKPKVQAFVDGSPFVGDVKVGANWSTYLFSTLGRGGKGVFALDVTDPTVLESETNAGSVFKWQFTDSDDAADLGYIISDPTFNDVNNQPGQIAKMNNGKFAIILGNGVQSTSGKAVLYILFVDGPLSGNWSSRFVKITADTGSGNGLSQPIWVDNNNDGIADAIYAGDLKGNLWKFDVSSATTSNWNVAYSGKPLFIAKDVAGNLLPISTAPDYSFHPLGGVIVSFATGSAITNGDFPNPNRTDGAFGIWDNPKFAPMGGTTLDANLPRTLSQLKARQYNNVIATDDYNRYVTGDNINWTNDKGWYLPFSVTAESSLGNMLMANRQLIYVSVSPPKPKTSPTDVDDCNIFPPARINTLDPFTGLASDLFNSKQSVLINGVAANVNLASKVGKDQKIRISHDAVGFGGNPRCSDGSMNCYRFSGETTDEDVRAWTQKSRIFWREIPGLKTRSF
jgi:type IV pilus assembly protein PilY1